MYGGGESVGESGEGGGEGEYGVFEEGEEGCLVG